MLSEIYWPIVRKPGANWGSHRYRTKIAVYGYFVFPSWGEICASVWKFTRKNEARCHLRETNERVETSGTAKLMHAGAAISFSDWSWKFLSNYPKFVMEMENKMAAKFCSESPFYVYGESTKMGLIGFLSSENPEKHENTTKSIFPCINSTDRTCYLKLNKGFDSHTFSPSIPLSCL